MSVSQAPEENSAAFREQSYVWVLVCVCDIELMVSMCFHMYAP